MSVKDMSAEEVASKAMNVAASMCVHTNTEFITHTLEDKSSENDENDDSQA
jgi:ATP-dependent protease HslVU (ClpYQ) peptidase subunit